MKHMISYSVFYARVNLGSRVQGRVSTQRHMYIHTYIRIYVYNIHIYIDISAYTYGSLRQRLLWLVCLATASHEHTTLSNESIVK